MNSVKYYIAWFQYHQQDGYLLWIEKPEVEYLWTSGEQQVPAFRNQKDVMELAQKLGVSLEAAAQSQPINLDVVSHWLDRPEKMPSRETLDALSIFDDLSHGIDKLFSGNVKAPVRNRVFDLLYLTAGVWRSPSPIIWPRQERTVLRRILRQGFRLWSKHVYWAERGQLDLNIDSIVEIK